MKKIIVLGCLISAVLSGAELLPPVGPEWKPARNAAAQAQFKITELNQEPALQIKISSESGYAFYRTVQKLPPGEYTFQFKAAGNSVSGLCAEIYSFDTAGKPRAILLMRTPAGAVQATVCQRTFVVPKDSAQLRIGVGFSGKGEAFFTSPRILNGKVPAQPDSSRITHPAAAGWIAQWIWLKNDPGLPQVDFAKEFELSAAPASALIQLTADNGYVLSVNGEKIGSDVDWKTVEIYDIARFLRKGKNRIEVNVLNYDGLAGLLLQGLITDVSGKITPVVSDSTWSISRPDRKPAELQVIGKVPVPPWGKVPFNRIAPPRLLPLRPLESEPSAAPGGVLKFVFPLTAELENLQPDAFRMSFYDAKGSRTPLSGLSEVIRIEKKSRRLFAELPVSRFAPAGRYRAEIRVNEFLIPCGDVVIAEFKPFSEPGLPLPKPSDANRVKTPTGEQSLYIYATDTPTPEHFRSWSQTGGHFYEVALTAGQWTSPESYATEVCERDLLRILENDPNASIILKIRIDVPGWWVAEHPNEVFRSNKNRSALQSFCSDSWRRDAVKAIGGTLKKLSRLPAGKAVSGIILMGFRGGEFQLWGEDSGEYDCSPAAQTAFQKYLQTKGVKPVSLPHPALEYPFKSNDPASAEIRDLFFRFTAERHAENLVYMTSELRKQFGSRYTIGVYFGYGMEHSANLRRMLYSGHLNIEKILQDAPIDLLSNPISYNLRRKQQSHAFMFPVDSARLHNILPVAENDIRNYRTPEYSDSSGVTVFSLYDSILTNRRVRLMSAAHGALVRYLALHPTVDFYAAPAIVRSIIEDDRLVMPLKANAVGETEQLALAANPLEWTRAWRLPQQRVTDFAGNSRDTVMRTGRECVFLTFADYSRMIRKFRYAVIPLPGLLTETQRQSLEQAYGKLPPIREDDGALLLNNGKWEIVQTDLKEIWNRLATPEAKAAGYNTVWYIGANFRYAWDGQKLSVR